MKMDEDSSNTSTNFEQNHTLATQNTSEETVEFDESISMAIKTALQREINNWDEVKDKWQKTFLIRQKDFHNLTIVEFLKAWPKFIHSQAPDLVNHLNVQFKFNQKLILFFLIFQIDIDFELMHPGNKLLLFSKWDLFKTKIKAYYESNINNLACKELLNISKTITNCGTVKFLVISK